MSRPVRSTTPRKPYVPEPEAPSAEKPLRRSSEIVKLNALTSNQQEAFGDLPDDVRSELFGLDFDSWDDVKDTLKCTDEVVATIQKIVQDTVLSKKRKTEVKEEDGDVEGDPKAGEVEVKESKRGRPKGSKKKKEPKDGEGATPKKLSGYMAFCAEHRELLLKEIPNLAFGEMGKELGALWRTLSDEERAYYKPPSTVAEAEGTATANGPAAGETKGDGPPDEPAEASGDELPNEEEDGMADGEQEAMGDGMADSEHDAGAEAQQAA